MSNGEIKVELCKKKLEYEYNGDLNEFLISKIAYDIVKLCDKKNKKICSSGLIIELKYILSRNISRIKYFQFKNNEVNISIVHKPQVIYCPLEDSDTDFSDNETEKDSDSDDDN